MKHWIAILFAAALLPAGAEIVKNPDENTLWKEDGKAVKWRESATVKVTPLDNAEGFRIAGTGATGIYVPMDRAYPYLVWEVVKVEPLDKGYRAIGSAAGNLVTRPVTGKFCAPYPGIPEKPGVRHMRWDIHRSAVELSSMAMVKNPPFLVELKSDKPVKPGDELEFSVKLPEKAEAVELSLYDSYTMPKLKLNGKTALPMQKADADGKLWTLKLKLESLTGGNLGKEKSFKPRRILLEARAELGDKMQNFYGFAQSEVEPAQ